MNGFELDFSGNSGLVFKDFDKTKDFPKFLPLMISVNFSGCEDLDFENLGDILGNLLLSTDKLV